MQLERTFSGLEARLKIQGAGRFFGAAFLSVWLVGWAAGEAFALWMLSVGAWSLITGRPPEAGRAPLELAPSLVVGVFLLFWLALWTVGGVAALYEWMRLLWARDRLVATTAGLRISRRVGFWSKTRIIPRDQLRSLYRIDHGPSIMAETIDETIEVTRLGRAVDQEELLRAFRTELALPDRSTMSPTLPKEWREISAPEGGKLLLKNPATRRKQTIVAWMATLPVGVVGVVVTSAALQRSTLWPLAVIVDVVALALLWGSVRLTTSRTEWKLETGKLTLQRRTGSRVRTLFEGHAVTLNFNRDSDGDASYSADVIGPIPPNATPRELQRARRTVLRQMHDATEPRRMAEWIKTRCQVPYTDLPPSGTTIDLAVVTRQLATSGRVGRWAARLLARADKNRPSN